MMGVWQCGDLVVTKQGGEWGFAFINGQCVLYSQLTNNVEGT
jgi:hypothetical protein